MAKFALRQACLSLTVLLSICFFSSIFSTGAYALQEGWALANINQVASDTNQVYKGWVNITTTNLGVNNFTSWIRMDPNNFNIHLANILTAMTMGKTAAGRVEISVAKDANGNFIVRQVRLRDV